MKWSGIIFLILIRCLPAPVHAQDATVPSWAKRVVWYQIFPERFCNGDTTNDPSLEDIKGCWPHDDTSPWHVSPWTSDWYEMQPWEKENGKDIWYQLQRRRYGGDLQGIINKLDYLEKLGVGAIYLNPVFMAPSLHKYDAAMYHHIEPTFGPDPQGDKIIIASEDPSDPLTWQWTSADKLALQLIDECHKRHIKIIFDGVFNHMGVNSFAFQDVMKNQSNSKYKDWFTILSWRNAEAGTEFKYQGWFGVPDLPEIREDENGIVDGPKQYIYACTKRWMSPDGNAQKGIDGWRLDVAFCIDHDFWKDWREFVKSINPEAYLTAEVIDKIDVVKPYLQGDEFDAVMNYGFAVICSEFFVNEKNKISVSEFDSLLRELRNAYPDDITGVMQNLFDSHDTQRFTSYLHNPDAARFRTWGDYFNKTKATNPAYDTGKPTAEEYEKQKLMALFQFTYPGAPMIYYGDEVGMWGANDPDCRKPMLWSELNYDDEIYNWNGRLRNSPDEVTADTSLYHYYQTLANIRNNWPSLSGNEFKTLFISDKKNTYAYVRAYHDADVNMDFNTIVIINNSSKNQTIEIEWKSDKVLQDLIGGNVFTGYKDKFKIRCGAFDGFILFEIPRSLYDEGKAHQHLQRN